jgi:ACR3 family arsenite efflux pump ArsB
MEFFTLMSWWIMLSMILRVIGGLYIPSEHTAVDHLESNNLHHQHGD